MFADYETVDSEDDEDERLAQEAAGRGSGGAAVFPNASHFSINQSTFVAIGSPGSPPAFFENASHFIVSESTFNVIHIESDQALQIVNDLQHRLLLDAHALLFSQYPDSQQRLLTHDSESGPSSSGADDPGEQDAHIPDIIERLDELFREDKDSYTKFLAHRGDSAQWLLDLLQDILDYKPNLATINRRRLFKALIRLSGASKLYPRCFPLTGLDRKALVAGGTFGDVYTGLLRGQSVAIKMMRVFDQSDIDALLKGFGREALIWRQLSHPNLLPFYGLYYFQRRLCLVSPWMDNGHIRAFLKKKMYCTDCLLSLILDVARGLEYLHSKGVVHGDLKGDNIFVTASCRACLADFGFASIRTSMASIQFTNSSQHAQGGTARYQAPELHRGGQNDHLTDIYAFACLVYELLTGKAPFPELNNDVAVAMTVIEGGRPSRPSSCSGTSSLDALWNLLQNCWEEKPENRPTASQLVERLKGDDIKAMAAESTSDWDDTFTSKFRRLFLGERAFPTVIEFERVVYGSVVELTETEPADFEGTPTGSPG